MDLSSPGTAGRGCRGVSGTPGSESSRGSNRASTDACAERGFIHEAGNICASGAVIAWKGAVGAYVLTPPLLFGYYVALSNAWVLTIEINR